MTVPAGHHLLNFPPKLPGVNSMIVSRAATGAVLALLFVLI